MKYFGPFLIGCGDTKHPWRHALIIKARTLLKRVRCGVGLLGLSLQCIVLEASERTASSEYLVETFQIENGLPQNSVTTIAQTSDGYLWMGTFNGLARFDGARFVVFDTINTPELRSSRIVALKGDRDGRLWIVSEFGDFTVWENGQFTNQNETMGKVGSLVEDFQGNIWAQKEAALVRIKDGFQISLEGEAGLEMGRVVQIVSDELGNFWIKRKHGMGIWRGESIEFMQNFPGTVELPVGFFPAREGGLWVATTSGLTRYQDGQFLLPEAPFPMSSEAIGPFFEDSRGNVWVGTSASGLMRYDGEGNWELLNTSNGLSHNSIRIFYEDREGTIWVGTDGGGLNQIKDRTFQSRGEEYGVVLSITQDREGSVWIGFNGEGIKRLDGERFVPMICLPFLSKTGSVWSLYASRNGGVWTGDLRGGLLRFFGEDCEQRIYSSDHPVGYLRALLEDRDGAVWAGHSNGLLRFDKEGYSLFTTKQGLLSNDIRALTEDGEGNVYIGTNGGGVARYSQGLFEAYTMKDGLVDDRVWSLYHDSIGSLWIGGFGRGLGRWRDGTFFNFDTAIPAKVVTSILEDHLGFLWLGSMKGIFRVHRDDLNAFAEGKIETIAYRHFGSSDGLLTIEMQPSAWKMQDGSLWFATIKGAAVVDPTRLPFNAHPPPVIIEEASIDGRVHFLAGASNETNQVLRVSPGSLRTSFAFTALTFISPQMVRFKYRMEGLDLDWIETDGQRVCSYYNLPPGSYTFRVIACNNNGIWNSTGASLSVLALPHFWQTWWFKMAIGLALAGMTWGAYRIRLAQVISMNRLRMRIAGDLHDEIGANLGSIGLNTDLLMTDSELTKEQRKELSEIGVVTARTIHALREIVWFANPDFDNVPGMLLRMREVAAQLLGGRQWRFEAADSDSSRPLPLEFRRNVFLIFKEALHNVVKHSKATEVSIRVHIERDGIGLSVEDNGCGFVMSDPGREGAQGLRSLRRRSEELGGTVRIESQSGRGTKIEIWAPYRKRNGRAP